MEPQQTKVSKFLTSVLPEFSVKTDVGINSNQLAQAAAIIFIAAFLVILSFFAIKKILK